MSPLPILSYLLHRDLLFLSYSSGWEFYYVIEWKQQ